MNGVDTNILVRWITRDDPAQCVHADRVMDKPTFVSMGVLIELVWVLGGRSYRFDRETIVAILTTIVDLDRVTVAQEDDVRWAIERYSMGADFADMIHIAAARGSALFTSFEKHLTEDAGPDTPVSVQTLT